MRRDARPRRPRTTNGRASLALAAVAVAAAAVLAALAFVSGPDPDAAVLVVEDVVADSPPVTIPRLAAADVPPTDVDVTDSEWSAPDPSATASDRGGESTSTPPPLSPLAALVGERGSAIPPVVTPRARPVGLTIDDIFVDDRVRTVGLEPDGQLEVPGADEIGWYRYGSAPGRPGATVLAAHVTWNGEYGPFLNLGALEPGDEVVVELDDGSERVYEVVERTMYDKDGLPRDRIWRTTGEETLVLITCGGEFNPDISRYRENIVVYAVPVG